MPFSSKSKQRAYQREYQRNRRKKKSKDYDIEPSTITPEIKMAIIITILLVVAILSILSFFDLAGPFGFKSKDALLLLFGWGAYLFPVLLIAISLLLLKGVRYQFNRSQVLGVVLLFLSLLGILHHAPIVGDSLLGDTGSTGGGYIGYGVLYPFNSFAGYWGAWVFMFGIAVVGVLLSFSNILFGNSEEDEEMEEDVAEEEHDEIEEANTGLVGRVFEKLRMWRLRKEYDTEEFTSEDIGTAEEQDSTYQDVAEQPTNEVGLEESKVNKEPVVEKRTRKRIQIPLDLLESSNEKPSASDIDTTSEKIEKTFATFGIDVEMDEINIGPTVTQYTLKPPVGVKLSRITGLTSELSLALAAQSLRMEAPIPGKSLVGIELPNKSTATVKLKDILLSSSFKKRNSNLTLSLGKDVSGKAWVADLSKMPHLLIAGSTGSGKSVAINALIISLLYQNSPEDLKLVLVDPKKVELTTYNDIPYLLTPVITDAKKTINALKWMVGEMERRYQLLSNRGKRNIHAYNESNKKETIPHIVFVIDELADLMSVAANDVEAAIVRLAQMARAVGIHLILATQRPSVNVITGLIKANIPARIAFAVPSQIDSRTILDSAGAEKLLGKGDMLFTASDANKPRRLQGAFLGDDEIERVVNFLRDQGQAEYHDEVTEQQGGKTVLGGGDNGDDADDELYDEAKQEIITAGKASASLLQRRLRIGYSRAARLLDLLESEGIIGPADGAKPRELLISQNQNEEIEISVDDEAEQLESSEETEQKQDFEK